MRNTIVPTVRSDDGPFGDRSLLRRSATAEGGTFPLVGFPFAGIAGAARRIHRDARAETSHVDADVVVCALAALIARYSGSTRVRVDLLAQNGVRAVGFDFSGDPTAEAAVGNAALFAPADFAPVGFAVEPCAASAAYGVVVSVRDGRVLELECDEAVLDEAGAVVVLNHLALLVSRASAAYDRPITRLPFLGDEERETLLETINATDRPFRDIPPIALFDEVAAERAQDVALVVGDERITYGELAARSRRLGRWLIERGVGPGRFVGICLNRTSDLIVAVLAIAASGAAYVPLDPRNPAARQAQILEDATVDVVLAEAEFVELFPSVSELVVTLRDLDLATFSDAPLELRAGPADLAYVIFTSGSTGRPKGVMIDNHALAAFVAWTREGFSDEELSGVLCSSSIAFDVSVFEIFAPLCHGGRCILVDNILALADAPSRDEVRVVSSVASGLAELTREHPLPRGVRTVLQAGERLHAALARRLLQHPGGLRLLNLCGGTEDTVYSVWQHVTSADTDPAIGRPFSNHTVYVVDAALQPVPVGVPGEICYGGHGVARGYIGRPDLSAQRFVPNPFGHSARMYRSGDLVRWNAHGEVEFITRLDDQLKVRGHRVELAEIEHHLLENASVAQALVVPVERGGDVELAAYVVGVGDGVSSAPARSDADVVAGWNTVYDDLYAQTAGAVDPQDDFAGWIDSFGSPFPLEQMRAWADGITQRILADSPRSVLEIGCGKGLIALRLAPHVTRYVGTDFSASALERLAALTGAFPHVSLAQLAGDELDRLPAETFDVVVINSVVQYFPSHAYLEAVLRGALARLTPGGRILLGDVRNPRVAPHLYERIERVRAPHASAGEIDAAVRRRGAAEEELLVDPSFFTALAAENGPVRDVTVLAKNGLGPDELDLFRYDVVLSTVPRPARDVLKIGFADQLRSQTVLDTVVDALRPPFALTSVPDVRLVADGVDVAALAARLSARGLTVELSPHDDGGCVDVLASETPRTFAYTPSSFAGPAPAAPASAETDRPTTPPAARPDLRAFLAGRLPSYMIPSAFVWLEAFPHGASGKIDRAALPDPFAAVAAAQREYVEPRTAAERDVAAVWSEVLGTARVGAEDDLFALGGHSLTAARIIARLRDRAPGLTLGKFFQEPTVAAVARFVVGTAPDDDEAIAPAAPSVDSALSYAQETMWFLDRVLPDGAVYNVPVAWEIDAPDAHALQRALNALVARHDQLRTIFPDVDGQPVARTLAHGDLPLRRERLASDAELNAYLVEEARRPFDLERGPLVRAVLAETGERAVLMVTYHHIVADGWARTVLSQDLYELYAAAREGREPVLAPLEVTYAEYVRGERDAAELYETDLRWWAEQLRDLPRFDLPGNRIPPAVRTVRGGRVEQPLDAKVVASLEDYAKRHSATRFSTVLAAYVAFLARYSGESEIVIGTPLAGRRYRELDPIVGNFIEMVTLRLDVEHGSTFDEVTATARRVLLDALDHQAAPFRLVVERVASVRSQTQNPLFSVAIVSNEAVATTTVAGTRFAPLTVHTATSKFDILLEVIGEGDGITLGIEFARDRFDEPLVRSLLDTFARFLEAAVDAPHSALEALPLVRPSTPELAGAQPVAAPATPVNLRFRAHADEQPDAVALVENGEAMTYGRLRERADSIRAALAGAGVVRGDLVGLCATPSCDLIAAMIAILDHGAGYVPLDPRYPVQRLAYIASDARLKHAVADEGGAHVLADLGLTVTPFAAADGPAPSNPVGAPVEVASNEPAYVIYTSGSTGNPKGVLVEHGNVGRLFCVAGLHFEFGARDVWTLFHSYAFDFSVWEIWGALAYGGTLVIVSPDVARSPREFHRLVSEQGVTVLNQTPSAFYEFDAADTAEPLPLALRYIVLGGEGIDTKRFAEWFRRHPESPRVVNMYGITETTVHVTYHELTPADLDAAYGPIGTPLDDLTIELLDPNGMPVPTGFVGEINVLGAGVARGYLNNPHATAARFSTVMRRGVPVRSYRSGDLARRREDGTYEYVGRADQQIKVRGFRVEPGEIEAALSTNAAVKRCVVLAEGTGAETRLVAYVVPADAVTRLPDLRAHLAPQLPAYMIPSQFVAVRALPLTTNGKLDRRALAAVVIDDRAPSAPETAESGVSNLELELQALFAELLGVPHVGVEDSFFALGGHSLLAARLASRVEAKFPAAAERLRERDGRGATLRTFYSRPTVRALAEALEGQRVDATPVVRMRDGSPDATPVFWLHGMFNGDGLYTWDLVAGLPSDSPFYVVHPHGYDNRPFPADIAALAADHLALIREVCPRGPYIIGGFCNGALVALEIAQQLRAAGEVVENLVLVSLPPMYVAAERSYRTLRPVMDVLRIDRGLQLLLLSKARVYNNRLVRCIKGSWSERLSIVSAPFRRSRPAGESTASNERFSDPFFKHVHYLRAISRYPIARYDGKVTLVFGEEVRPSRWSFVNGWGYYLRNATLQTLSGGHFCLVDHARSLGRLIARADDGKAATP